MGKILFALVMLAISVAFAYVSATTAHRYVSSQSWSPVPAELLDVEWESGKYIIHRTNPGTVQGYEATARYKYIYERQTYRSNSVGFEGGLTTKREEQRAIYDELVVPWKNGRAVTAYVNPAQPTQAVLYRKIRWVIVSVQAIVALIAFLLFIAVFVEAVND